MVIPLQSSLVFRLLFSISVLMFFVFIVGNVITVRVAKSSLTAQGERQLALQKEEYNRQVEEARKQLMRKLQPQIEMISEFSKGPLIMRLNEVEVDANQTRRQIIDGFKDCFGNEDEGLLFACIRARTLQAGTSKMISSLNRTFISTAINFLVTDEDLVGIYVEDWESQLYAGFYRNKNNEVIEMSSIDTFPKQNSIVEREIFDDGEYIGKLVFAFTTQRITTMQEATEQRIREAEALIDQNILERSREITLNRIIEGALFFCALLLAISFIAIKTIIRPIQTLRDSANQLARGELDGKIDTSGTDEVGSLAISFASMRDAIRETISELNVSNIALTQTKQRLERILEATREIASAHEKFTPIIKALDTILAEIPLKKSAKVHLAFKEAQPSGNIGYSHFQFPIGLSANGFASIQMNRIGGLKHFFSNQVFAEEPSEYGSSGVLLRNHVLRIPIEQKDHFLALIEIEGVNSEVYGPSEQDFVETLSRSLAIALKNIDFTQELAEKIRMEGELKTAAAVQQALFPKTLPEVPNVQLATFFRSASETGGDWYGFMKRFDQHLYVMIGDVTGHGTPAALVTATASATCKILEEMYYLRYAFDREVPSPAECMKHLNNAIFEAGHPDFLMTFFIACINLDTGALTFSNAGHNFPLIVRANGKVKRLLNANSRLGYAKDWMFSQKDEQLEHDDLILFYTDGLTENENTAGEMWGEKRLVRALRRYRNQSAQAIVDQLIQENDDFSGQRALADDITVVCTRITAPFPHKKETN